MIIHAKEQFYLNANGLLDENSNNSKAFWSLVQNVMGNYRSTVIPPLINPVANHIVANESDKANVLNNYFCYISSTANNIDPPSLPQPTPFSLDVDDINDDDVKDILKSLQIGKESGGDFISHQMLKILQTLCTLNPWNIFLIIHVEFQSIHHVGKLRMFYHFSKRETNLLHQIIDQ